MNYIKSLLFKVFLICGWLSLPTSAVAQKNASGDTEVRKRAEKLFAEGNYSDASGLFSQLLSVEQGDTLLNYYYGACLSMSTKDRKSALQYLDLAARSKKTPSDVWYYYGRSLMSNGKFNLAAESFKKLSSSSSASREFRDESALLTRNCESALRMENERVSVAFISVREIQRTNFISSYDFSLTPGKVIAAADQFLTTLDKDKLVSPVMYMTKDLQTIYLASFGKKAGAGKDLHVTRKQPNGQWSPAENLGAIVNSTEHEDYPFLDRDGRTLYFSSRGLTSMGGYDIFKTVYDFNTGTWSDPENLGMQINTVEDDLLFVPSSDGRTATYATAEDAPNGKLNLRVIELPRAGQQLAVIKGFYKSIDQQMRRDARISVVRNYDNAVLTSVRTDPRTGQYELVVPSDDEYILIVEGGGYVPHAEMFRVPGGHESTELKQVVAMNKVRNEEELKLTNYFTPKLTSSGELLTEASETPTQELLSKTNASEIDSSKLMVVQIDNKAVYVKRPETQASNTGPVQPVALNVSSADDDELTATGVDKYDPTLDRGLTADELRQKAEEQERSKLVEAEERGEVPEVKVDISNEDLARLAIEDAKEDEAEAIALTEESKELKSIAYDKVTLATQLEEQLTQIPSSDTTRQEEIKIQVDELRGQSLTDLTRAAELDSMASEHRMTAEQSRKEAMELLESKGDVASKNGKSPKGSRSSSKGSQTTERSAESMDGNNMMEMAKGDPSETERANPDDVINEMDSLEHVVSTERQIASVANEGSVKSETSNQAGTINDLSAADNNQNRLDAAFGAVQSAANETQAPPSAGEKGVGVAAPSTEPVLGTVAVVSGQSAAEKGVNKSGSAIQSEQFPVVSSKAEPADRKAGDVQAPGKAVQSEEVKQNTGYADPASVVSNTSAEARSQPFGMDVTVKSGDIIESPALEQAISEKTPAPGGNPESMSTVDNKTRSREAKSESVSPSGVNVSSTAPSASGLTFMDADKPTVNASEDNAIVKESSDKTDVSVRNTASAQVVNPVDPSGQTSANSTVVLPVPEVQEEAKELYRAYETTLGHSKELDRQSKELQNRISGMKLGPERDSIISLSDDMSAESIRKWQSAQQILAEAKQIDPEVEEKMKYIDLLKSGKATELAAAVNEARNSGEVRASSGQYASSGNAIAENETLRHTVNASADASGLANDSSARTQSDVISLNAVKSGSITSFLPSSESPVRSDSALVKKTDIAATPVIPPMESDKSGNNDGVNEPVAVNERRVIEANRNETTGAAPLSGTTNEKMAAEGNQQVPRFKASDSVYVVAKGPMPTENTISKNVMDETDTPVAMEGVVAVREDVNQPAETKSDGLPVAGTTGGEVPAPIRSKEDQPANVKLTDPSAIQTAEKSVNADQKTAGNRTISESGNQPVEIESNEQLTSPASAQTTPGTQVTMRNSRVAEPTPDSVVSGIAMGNVAISPSEPEQFAKTGFPVAATGKTEDAGAAEPSPGSTPSGIETGNVAISPSEPEQVAKAGFPVAVTGKTEDAGVAEPSPGSTPSGFATGKVAASPSEPEQFAKAGFPVVVADKTNDSAGNQISPDVAIKEGDSNADQRPKISDNMSQTVSRPVSGDRRDAATGMTDVSTKVNDTGNATDNVAAPTVTVESKSDEPGAQMTAANSPEDIRKTGAEAEAESETEEEVRPGGFYIPIPGSTNPPPVSQVESKERLKPEIASQETTAVPAQEDFTPSAEYVQMKRDIETKQDETIRLFSEAVALNQRAVEAREKQVSLMDEAEKTSDENLKASLLKESEVQRISSEKFEQQSRDRYAEAQKLGEEAKSMIAKADQLKSSEEQAAGISSAVRKETVRQDVLSVPEKLDVAKITSLDVSAVSIRQGEAYTRDHPIPFNPELPEGLVFKVQIGAFRKPIPDNSFGGLMPVTAENTRPGWIRYCVGQFRTFDPANLAKKEMRRIGYKDAFVAAYYNGKRISLPEAYAMINKSDNSVKAAYASVSRDEMEALKKVDIRPSKYPASNDADEAAFFGTTSIPGVNGSDATESNVDGSVLYAVQVGVYRTAMLPASLASLQPAQAEPLQRGLYRFTTGRFDTYQSADSMKRVAVSAGVKDAFIVALRNGKRVSIPSNSRSKSNTVSASASTSTSVSASNSASASNSTIYFRVQLGAFRETVPFDVVDAFLKMAAQGIDRKKDERGLEIFYSGRYADYTEALKAKDDAVSKGVKDAFVVAFSGDRKIPVSQALQKIGE